MFDRRLGVTCLNWTCLILGVATTTIVLANFFNGSTPFPDPERVVLIFIGLMMLTQVAVLDRRSRLAEHLQSRLDEILERSPEGIVAVDQQGRIVYANPQTSQLFGYHPDELLGKTADFLWPRTDLAPRADQFPSEEFVTHRKEGEKITLKVTGTQSQHGRLSTFFLRDTTKHKKTQEVLAQREAFLQMVTGQMPAILWTTDTDLQITSSMGAGLAALNMAPHQIIGLTMLENLGGDVTSTPITAHYRAVKGESLSYEMDWKGSIFQVRVDPLRDHDQKITGTIGIVLDVTAKKQTMKELRARERQQAAVAQLGQRALEGTDWEKLTDEAVHLIAETLQVKHCQMFEVGAGGTGLLIRTRMGWSQGKSGPRNLAEAAIGSKEALLVHDLAAEHALRGPQMIREHGMVSAMAVVLPAQPAPRGVLAVYSPEANRFTKDDLNFLQAIANVLATSLQRREAEENQTRLVAILEATPDMVGVVSMDHSFIYLNRAGREILGLGTENPAKFKLNDFYANEAQAHLFNEQMPTAITHGVCQADSTLRNQAGENVPVSQLVLAHKSPTGSVQFFAIIAHDIRRRLELESQFRQSQKMEAVGRLAGGIAHDFNNLLCVILGNSGLLLEQLGSADARHGLAKEVNKAGERAAGLTRQLLAFSRKQMLVPAVLNLNSLISNVETMFRRLIGEDIELRLSLDAKLYPVKADPGQVEQILMNLAVNARDAMSKGGVLTLSTANVALDEDYVNRHPGVRPGDFARITVSDTGSGMNETVKAHLFEPFFTTKEVGKGTGLGLATVYGIVKQSNGHIEVQSILGEGTTFHVFLPRVDKLVAAPTAISKPVQNTPKGRETILIVEDEDGVRSLTRTVLQAAGYTILEAADGEQAVELCKKRRGTIDLLLSDVVMPRLGGSALVKQLVPLHPEMKVMFVSGYSDSALVNHGIMTGEVECLLKPFTPDALVQKVREVLDREPALV